jgi:hypothetical protein
VPASSTASRPPVAVVLPFYGQPREAAAAAEQLGRLDTREGDELVLVDNTEDGAAAGAAVPPGVRVVRAELAASAYAARNSGVAHTSAPWILFVDADCRLPRGLLDAFFAPAPEPAEGAVAGQVLGAPGQAGRVPRYIRSRGHLDQELLSRHPYRPMAVTACLLVRREAFEAVGGFAEPVRTAADADLCWRLQDNGWRLGLNSGAGVHHEHRATLRELLAQARRDGAGGPWLARRYPGHPARPPASEYPRAVAGALGWPLLGRPERGLFKAMDGLWCGAFAAGSLVDPVAPEPPPAGPRLIALVAEYATAGDPLGDALAEEGDWHVEALRRPARAAWPVPRPASVRWWEDEPALGGRRAALRRAARRVGRAAPGALLLAEPALLDLAGRLRGRAAAEGLRVEPLPADRAAAAALVRRYAHALDGR